MGKDKRGVERGRCMRCRCVEYVAHTSPENHNCGYCECAPMQHEEHPSLATAAQARTQREMQHLKRENNTLVGTRTPSLAYHHQGNFSEAPYRADQTMTLHPGQLQDNRRTQKKQIYSERGPNSQEELYAKKYGSQERDSDPNHLLRIECIAGRRSSEYYGKAGDTYSFQQTLSENFAEVESDVFSKKPPNSDSGHGTSTERSPPSATTKPGFQRGRLYSSTPYQIPNQPYDICTTQRHKDHEGRPHGEVLHGAKVFYNVQPNGSHVHQRDHVQRQPSTTYMHQHSDLTRGQGECLGYRQRYGGKSPLMEQLHVPNQQYGGHVSHATLPGRNEGHRALPLYYNTLHGERSDGTQRHDSTLANGSHSPQISGDFIYRSTTHQHRGVVGSKEQHDIQNQLPDSLRTNQNPVQPGKAIAGSVQFHDSSQSYSPHISHTSSERGEDIVAKMKHLHEKLRKLEEEQTSVKRELQNIISGVIKLPVSETEFKASMELLHMQENHSDSLVKSLPTWKQPSMHVIPGGSVHEKNLMEAKMTLPPRQNPLNLGKDVPRGQESGSSLGMRDGLEQSLRPAAKPLVTYNSDTDGNNQSGLVNIYGQDRERDIGSSQGSSLVESSEQQVATLEDSNSDNDRNKQSPPRQSSLDQQVDISEEQQGSSNLKSRPLPNPKESSPQTLAKPSDSYSNKQSHENERQVLSVERNLTKAEFESTSRQTSENKAEATENGGLSLDSIPDHITEQPFVKPTGDHSDTYGSEQSIHDQRNQLKADLSSPVKQALQVDKTKAGLREDGSDLYSNPCLNSRHHTQQVAKLEDSNSDNKETKSSFSTELESPEKQNPEDQEANDMGGQQVLESTPPHKPEQFLKSIPMAYSDTEENNTHPGHAKQSLMIQTELPARDIPADLKGEGSMHHAVSTVGSIPLHKSQSLQQVVKLQDGDSDTSVTTLAMTGSGSHVSNLCVDDGHLTSVQDPVPNSSQELPISISDSEMSTEEYFSASGSEMDVDDMYPLSGGARKMSRKLEESVLSSEVSRRQDEPVSSSEVSRRQDEPVSSSEVERKQDEPTCMSSSEVERKQDELMPSSEVPRRQDEPVSSSEVSRKQDELMPSSEVSRRQDEPVSTSEVSRRQDEPVSSSEVERKQDEPMSSSEVSRKQDEPVSSSEVERKQDEPMSSSEVARKQDEPVSSSEVERKQDEPMSSSEVARKQDEPVSSSEVERKQDEPMSSSEVARKQEEPVSSSEVLRKQDEPVSGVSRKQGDQGSQVSKKQDKSVSSSGVLSLQVPMGEGIKGSSALNSRNQDEPMSSSEVSKKQDEAVSSSGVSSLEVSMGGDSSAQVSRVQHTPVSTSNPSGDKGVFVSNSEALQDVPVNSKTARQGLPVFSSQTEEEQGSLPPDSKMKREPNLHLAGLEKRDLEQIEKTTHRSPFEERDPSRDIRIGPEISPGERKSPVTNIPSGWQVKKEASGKHVNTQLDRSRTHTRLKWKDQHDTFHPTVHGKNIKIESNGTTARRDQFYTDGICFSQFPIKMGCNVHLKIVESKRFRGSMRIGFTLNNPEDMSVETLPAHSYPEVPQGFWIKPLHDKLAQQGYVVTYMVDSSGDVFYSINGEEKGLFFSGVDVTRELWAAVDIHGSTIAVQFANDQVVSDAVNKNIHEGDQVMLQVETVETLQLLQEGHGGMHNGLEKAIGDKSVGVAIRIDDDEDVRVFYKKHNRVWCINPAALRKVGKVDPSVIIMEGDLVAIGNDLERIKALQKDHGEWVETMERTLGKIGRVTKITHQGDLRLRVDGKTWTYNAKAVSKITMRKGVSGTSRHSGNCDKGLHYWKRGVAKVCTKCGECTANGADCGLQGSPFRSRGSPCGCREKTGGCADCGLCHTCAGETEEETDHKQSKMAKLLRMLKKHVGEGDDSDDEEVRAIAVGDKVRVTTDAQTLPVLQREGGLEWHEDMLQVIGQDGRATEVSSKSVTVQFPHHGRWTLVPGCLTKVHIRVRQKGAETYQKGELVRVITDARQLKRIQHSNGGYSRDMAATLGKTGSVMRCKDGKVKVDVTGMSWWFHPSVLFRPVLKGRESLEGLHIKDGDYVRVDVDAETFKTNQLCHGGYVDRMEKSVEDFGVVHHIDIDGDAVVYYPDGTRWCINALSLGKVDPAECGQVDVSCVLEVADWVKVEEDKDRIKRVQEKTDCIRWQVGYYKAAGKVGQVRTTYPFNDVITVQIEGSGYPLNPKLLRRASPADLKEVFGSGDITNPGFTRGDLVKIAVDINKLRLLQDGHGGFVDRMEELLDLVGSVSFIDRDGDVYVRFSIRRLCFNPYSLTKVILEEDTFQVGDLVLIESDQERFRELQRPTKHGRYNPKMLPACGKVGRLLNVMDQDKVRVKVLGRNWVLNPQLVTRTGNPGLGTGDWKSATICAPNKHDWSTGRCLVCVKCGECTHYGRLCPARGKPGRYPGSLCGCGNGHAGCDDCGTCRGCAGEIQIHEDIESDGQDGWQGDAMEKLGVGEHQPTSSEKAAAHRVISAVLKKMSQAVDLMKKSGDKQSTDAASIKTVLENDFLLPFTKYVSSTHKKLMGDHLANIDAARVLLDQYLKCVPAEDIQGRGDRTQAKFDHECLQLLRKLLIHCTNSSFEFCRTVGRCNLLATLLQDLSTFHKRTQNDTAGQAIHSLVTILYNCARVPENQEYFSSGNVVSILTPYLRSKDEGIRITTLSCLAFIVEEDNLHFIRLNVDMTELIVSLLKDALDNPDHITTRGGFQYPALQVTTIISVLVRNDENKQILVTNGVVDLLIKMIETGDDREKESALLCIRKLADSEVISGIIRRETKVKKLLLPMRGDRKLSKSVRDAVAMTVDVLENGPPQETNFKGQGSITTIKCTDLLVDRKTPLGRGGFGVVFRGYHRRWMMNVALKRLQPLPKEQNLRVIEALIEEANFMRCAQNAYRFIVPLYGVCVDKELTALVMDFMENGSVDVLMFRVKHVPWALRWRILHETILGMNFLHSLDPQIIHCDLKSQNILLDEDFHAKITDFGLSKYKHLASKSRGSTGCLAGTITHIPPENLVDIHLKAGEKFDVYSFGILIWEVLTGQTPYENAQHSAHIRLGVINGQRPDTKAIPKVGPNELDFFKQLMEKCWHQFPKDRPQFRELGEQVQSVMQRTNVQVAEAVHAVRTALGKEEKDPMETQLFAAADGPES